jgi:ankyrin repeat protein
MAAKAGHGAVIPFLASPATLDSQNSQGLTPLQVALLYKRWEAATALVAAGAAPYGPDSTPSLACQSDEVPELGLLLKAMLADPSPTGLVAQAVNARDYHSRTALHNAASAGCADEVSRLVKAGADKHAMDREGATPLWIAAAAGHAHLVPLLATPHTLHSNSCGGTMPLHAAVQRRNQAVVTALLAAGALPDAQDSGGCSALVIAAEQGNVPAVKALLAAGATTDTEDYGGRSPLGVAAEQGHMKVVTLLLAALVKECDMKQQLQLTGTLTKQQQQRLRQQGQTRLAALVAAVVVPLATHLEDTVRCSQLLEVVLGVLGDNQELMRQVCQQVAVQLELQQQQLRGQPTPDGSAAGNNYLGEALLLGWLGAEARRQLPARLKGLVPQARRGQQLRMPYFLDPGVDDMLAKQVRDAILAATGTKCVSSSMWTRVTLDPPSDSLGRCARIYLHQACKVCAGEEKPGAAIAARISTGPSIALRGCGHLPQEPQRLDSPYIAAPPRWVRGRDESSAPWLVQVVHQGLRAAASRTRLVMPRYAGDAPYLEALPGLPSMQQVYSAILSHWVAARGAPIPELVGAVVAAVTQTQQQQEGGQHEEETEEELLSTLMGLLLKTDDSTAAAGR